MSKHTPGRWTASDQWGNFGDHNRHEPDAPTGQVSRFSYSVRDDQGFIVAHCTNPLVTMERERSEANARLIAAAPDLLHWLGETEHYLSSRNLTETLTEGEAWLLEHIQQTIRQAEGEA